MASRKYFDEETHLHENWNRYYDPVPGGYASFEPLLQTPKLARIVALQGHSLPAYRLGEEVPDAVMDKLKIKRSSFHSEWNYKLRPQSIAQFQRVQSLRDHEFSRSFDRLEGRGVTACAA